MENKKTTTTKKKNTTKKIAATKPVAKKSTAKKKAITVSKSASKKIDTLIKEVDRPVDPVEKLKKESEKSSIVESIEEVKPLVTEERTVTKKKLKVKPIFKVIILLALLVLISLYVPKFFCKKDSYKDKATYSNAFFIRNNKGKYALFNDKGKKLTGFIFDSAYSFINNSALVYKEKEGYAIINNKGKDVIDYGKYNYISAYSGVYKVRSDKGYKLLDSEGKTIIDAEDMEVSSYGDDYPFIVVIANNEVKVLSYDGSIITSFKEDKSVKSPTVNHISEYATIFYNGKNVVFNSKTKKVITSFKNDTHYCVSASSEDGKILTLKSCTTWYEPLTTNGNMIVVKNKATDLSKKCDAINLYNNVAICESVDGINFINISGKKASIGAKISNRTAFIDEENYVTRNSDTNKLVFYKNGKKVKTMDAQLSSIGKMEGELYVLYVDNGYEYSNKDAKKAISENFKYASSFDKNGVAKVSKDGTNYYLINKKGKKISKEYTSISSYVDYYQVTNKDGEKGVINKKGEVIIDLKYSSINIKEVRDTFYAITTSSKGKYALYNLDSKKLVKESKNQITISDHYIKVTGDSKTSYYTYKDKLIFEE